VLPQDLGAHAVDGGLAEAQVRVHTHRRRWVVVRAPRGRDVVLPGHALLERLRRTGQDELTAHDRDQAEVGVEARVVLGLEEELPIGDERPMMRERVLDLPSRHRRMTVKGIHYKLEGVQVVTKDRSGYRKVQTQVLKLREEGLLPWTFVADGTRWVRRVQTFDSVADALTEVSQSYRRDLWRAQGWRPEVWLEKDALADLIVDVTREWGVPLYVTRGNTGAGYVQSAAVDARRAFRRGLGRQTQVFTLYDFDAGGARAHRTVTRYFERWAGDAAIATRLGLHEDQIREWDLPTRPANDKGPESARWGGKPCVELDAVDPHVLCGLVDDAIRGLVDEHAWKVEKAVEEEQQHVFKALVADLRTNGDGPDDDELPL
jgi:hypothetical protein